MIVEDFNRFREAYNGMSYAEQSKFYNEVYDKYPFQNYANLPEISKFFDGLIRLDGPTPGKHVLEIGGWNGNTARYMLEKPIIDHWYNFEICVPAVLNGLKNDRYSSYITNDYVWNIPLPDHNVLFMAHTIEHLNVSQIRKILARTTAVHAFIEAPLPKSDKVDWNNDFSTHVLPLNWDQLETLFLEYDFEVYYSGPDLRFFRRV